MRLHADLSERVVLDTNTLEWVGSPAPGVRRRMLDRDGEEAARATSLVRYASGSHFSAHTHEAGEEFLVLEGVFADDSGDYPAGTYVRNPPGSRHRPFSPEGCTIFVKLRQMAPDDGARVVVDTARSSWGKTGPRSEAMPLYEFRGENVSLVRMGANADLPRAAYPGGEELFVLEGVLADERGTYPRGTWLRNPPGSVHSRRSESGCKFYLKTGHLPHASSAVAPDIARGDCRDEARQHRLASSRFATTGAEMPVACHKGSSG